jgi:peptidoglycan/LPS O-acetylase OafA/YrhL
MAHFRGLRNKEIERQPSIDFLRFMAAMMVATMHWGLEIGSDRYSAIYKLPIIGDLVKNGSFGVNIFFVISGFVIIGTAQRYTAVEFVFARFTRLFPGLFICMLIVLIVGSHFIQSYERPYTSFFHSVFLTYQAAEVEPLATPLWTLIIEIKFYLGVAIALLVFPSLFKTTKGIIALLIAWQLCIAVLQETTSFIGSFILPYLTLDGFSNLFALGVCFNLASNARRGLNQENVLILMVSLYFIYEVFFLEDYPHILKIYLALTSVLIIYSTKLSLNYSKRKLTYWLGLSSYPIYLLHEHLGMAIILQIQSKLSMNIYFVIGAASVGITMFSALIAITFEKPIQKYLKALFNRFYLKN